MPGRGATHIASKLEAGRKLPVSPPPPHGEEVGYLTDIVDLERLIVAAGRQRAEQREQQHPECMPAFHVNPLPSQNYARIEADNKADPPSYGAGLVLQQACALCN